jgi:hypothetical protein
MKCPKQTELACLIGFIRASACLMVASSGFYESHKPPPLVDVHDSYRRIAMAIETANKVGT